MDREKGIPKKREVDGCLIGEDPFESSDVVFEFVYYHSWILLKDRVRGNI